MTKNAPIIQYHDDVAFGEGDLPLVVNQVYALTPDINLYRLKHRDAKQLPGFIAGSHLSLPVDLGGGVFETRRYSICSDPQCGDYYDITVLRKEKGTGGSKSIHENYRPGLILHCDVPENYFSLHENNDPAILIAGGIGITPILSMAKVLKNRNAMFTLHYAGKSSKAMAFCEVLRNEFPSNVHFYISSENNKLNIKEILQKSPRNSIIYVCGPTGLIDDVRNECSMNNFDSSRIKYEYFNQDKDKEVGSFDLYLKNSDIVVHVKASQTPLEALLESGIDAPHGCDMGACGDCSVEVLEGEPEHLDGILSDYERDELKLFCPCVSRAKTQKLVLDM